MYTAPDVYPVIVPGVFICCQFPVKHDLAVEVSVCVEVNVGVDVKVGVDVNVLVKVGV